MRKHLSYANVISTFCLVLVVGGGVAYAANTIRSSDIVNGEVKSVDIGTAEVATVDIAANAVDSSKIADNSVTSADVANNSLRGADVAGNSLDGLDIQEGSLVLNEHFSAVAAPNDSCFDDNHTGEICATTTINLERSGRILMNAAGEWRTQALNDTSGPGQDTDNSTAVAGSCVLRVDGNSVSTPIKMGELSADGPTNPVHPGSFPGTFALTDLSGELPAGQHPVDVFCIENDGDIDWPNMRLTVARVDN